MTDYSLWEVIKNRNKVLRRTIGTVEQEYEPTTTKEKQDRSNEMKARATMLMALPNKDQLKFHAYQDAKLLMEAIEKRYGGNKESKKLEIQGEVINQEDMNLKLLRSLPSEWKTHALIWRNKVEIETISLDDLYNNLKIYEQEITDDTAHGVSTTHSTTHIQEDLGQLHPDDLEEMDLQWDMAMLTIRARMFIKRIGKKLDINGQREYKGRENNTRTIAVETPTQNALIAQDGIGGYDWSYQAEEEQPTNHALMAFTSSGSSSSSDSEVDSCSKTCVKAYASLKEQYDNLSSDYKKSQFNLVSYKAGLESVEARLAHYKKNEAVFEESINVLKLEVRLRDNALNEYKMNLEKAEKERDQLKQTLEKFQNSSKSLNNILESQVIDKFKTGLGYDAATAASPAVESFVNLTDKSGSDKGYHSVPPPLTGNFIPRKPDLTFVDEIVEIESNAVRMNNTSAPIIEDWNSDDESEIDYTVRPNTEKIESVKTVREIDAPKQNKQYPRGNQRNWNNLMSQRLGSDFKMTNKACYVCGSFEHLHYVCDKKVERTVWNNSRRVNHKNFTNKMTHPHPKRSFVPQAVLTRSGKLSTAGIAVNTVRPVNTANTKAVNTVRPVNTANTKAVKTVRSVNTATSKPIVNHPRTKTNAFKRGYSQSSRPFKRHFANKNSIINTNVNTARLKHTTARDRAVVRENKGKGANAVKASACWGNPQQKEYKEKGVIDSGCSRHMTGNKCYLDEYEDYDGGFVSFGDGKGRISGKGKIKTGSLDFHDVYFCKELKYNLFSVSQICDKKNNVLFTDTECLVLSSNFKLLDESQVLLRILRKDNIYSVDLKSVVPTGGLTCLIAKAIVDESNTWHRRLGHINFKTMNKLVNGNLVKGLPLKIFENDHSCVACQKGKQHKASYKTKLVNSISKPLHMLHMDLFGPTNVKSLMKKSYCLNDVAKRKNRTLIEAARNILVDSKLPTTFWAEAVNTACYVLNRVLVIKPHNKTPYELIRGRPPLIDFMKPFGCPVTILNTRDHLGKFDGKADEGYFVGYSVVSKAMRVFNKRTRIVEETLNIRFLENTPNVKGNGPDWLFDVDSLSISMNYVPVAAGNKTNGIAGTKDNIVAGQAQKEKEPEQEYILIPLCTTDPLISQGPKDCEGDAGMKPTEVDENEASDKSGKHDQEARSESERLNQREMQTEHTNSTNGINTVSTPVSTAGPSFDTAVPSTPVNAVGPSVSTANESEEQLFERFSPFKNAFTLPPVPNISSMDNTGIFGNAYDDEDVEEEVDMNNNDERGIVVKNKARLVTQGHTQEECIDYDKVFAPAARIEAIRLFLAYASFKDFVVYQMDVNSAFLYGKIEEEVYVCQHIGFEDPHFPYKVYKVEKVLYGLHQAQRAWYETLSTYLLDNGFHRRQIDKTLFIKRHKDDIQLVQFQMSSMGELSFFLGLQVKQKSDGIFISQDKYVAKILKKFDFALVKTASTLMETNKALVKDEEAEDVDENQKRLARTLHPSSARTPKDYLRLGVGRVWFSPFEIVPFEMKGWEKRFCFAGCGD
ncbi:ribonuclease H-like domain-containing protein [Tanacetum coccineum]